MGAPRNVRGWFGARIAACVATAVLIGVSGAASAATSGLRTAAPAPSGGGAAAPGPPEIADVVCKRSCVGLRRPTTGGVVEVSGENLGRVTAISFPSRAGRVLGTVAEASETSVAAKVPPEAIDGPIRVRDSYGEASDLSRAELDIRSRDELGSAGVLTLLEGVASPQAAFYFGTRAPSVSFVVGSDQALNDLRIDVVDADGALVRSFFRSDVAANTAQTVRWDGRTSTRSVAPDGSYAFRIGSQAGGLAARGVDVSLSSLAIELHGYAFPIRGVHDYGGAGSVFGAGRPGHSHQGHDVFAACGTKMVAARGGRVRYAGYQSSAGNYIVIDGRGTGHDTVYMHLLSAPRFETGDVVRTGQWIGEVGKTGSASGCHLHFERWTAPGWYVGGDPIDPLPSLKKWDRYS